MQALLATSTDMIMVSDRTGRITYARSATERVSDHLVAEFLAQHPFETIYPDDRATYAAALARFVASAMR